ARIALASSLRLDMVQLCSGFRPGAAAGRVLSPNSPGLSRKGRGKAAALSTAPPVPSLCRCRHPVRTQFLIERLRAFFVEENPRAFKLHPFARTRNGLFEPFRPLHIEVDIVRAPGNQRRRLELPQLRLDRKGMAMIKRTDEAFEFTQAFGCARQRLQIGVDLIVADRLWMFVGRRERRTIYRLVGEHSLGRSPPAA